ncbi:MAG: glycosyltransferase family 1 protein [Spirochaetes bacterium]|nr:glycosyltransferase family 1 protein [Spirochaetota bacterium]
MKIALVHYHLRRGGVTSVIMNQGRALAAAGLDFLLIAGEEPPFHADFPFAQVEGLGYTPAGEAPLSAQELADGILRAMESRWGEAADIVHFHNPLIRKNAVLIPALKILSRQGLRLLLHTHDMAEDFRPDVYHENEEYPENCHYAVINSRDYDFLNKAGLEKEGLHLIPNEVSVLPRNEGLKRTRILYPVRAIRRKNIGEALLLSLFIPKGTSVAITLPPSTKNDRKYERWVSFAGELGLPVEFALGESFTLAELLGSSICALTTSVKEGFGFSFLEPWTCGLGLVGRRIDYVCRDFENSGVSFDKLYSGIEIPRDGIPPGLLEQKIESSMARIYASFKMEMPAHVKRRIAEGFGGSVDFGRLDEELQEGVISALCKSPAEKRALASANRILEEIGEIGEGRGGEGLAEANRLAIEKSYGREKKQALLLDTYRAVMKTAPRHKICKKSLLELYLDPDGLFLVGISDGQP